MQAQVDWKENLKMVSKNGEIFEVNIFLMVLGYSRMKFVKLTSDKTQKTLFNCMNEAFKYLKEFLKKYFLIICLQLWIEQIVELVVLN